MIRQTVAAIRTIGWMFAIVLSSPSAFAMTWPSLEEAVRLARSNAPVSVMAAGEENVARAVGVGARMSSVRNPVASAVGDRGPVRSNLELMFSVVLPVEVGGQRGARIEEATRFLDWRSAGRRETEARLSSDIVRLYGAALVASARVRTAREAEATARAEAENLARRLDAGDVNVYDKSLAEAELARFMQSRVEAELERKAVVGRLAELFGAEISDPPEGGEIRPRPRSPIGLANLPSLVETSPLLRMLDAERVYWSSVRERAGREKYDALGLLLSGGRGELGEARVGAGLSWSIPVTRRNQGEIAVADAERDRAIGLAASVRRALFERMRSALDIYAASTDGIEQIDRTGIPAFMQAAEAAVAANRAGKTDLVHVLIARRDLVLAKARRLELVTSSWNAYAELTLLRGEVL